MRFPLPLPLALLPTLACSEPPRDPASNEHSSPSGAATAPSEPPARAADGPAGVPGAPSTAAEPETATSLLPATLRARFRVVDDTPRRDGERTVPQAIEHDATGLLFVFVPGGTFTLGSHVDDPDRFDDERPPRRVRLSGFYLAATETTLDAWRRGGGEGGSAPADDHPVDGVTWYEARDWCAANGLALPSEAQWEYSASGPSDDLFPWGHDPHVKGRANVAGTNDEDRWLRSAPVGSFPAGTSWCGALDLAGNVMEWCRDGWMPDHTDVPDGALDPLRAPAGDAPDVERIVRGGSYDSDALAHLRAAYRNALLPTLAGGNLGFRAVVPPF